MWPMQMMSATVNADLMRFYGEYAYGSISNIPRTTVLVLYITDQDLSFRRKLRPCKSC